MKITFYHDILVNLQTSNKNQSKENFGNLKAPEETLNWKITRTQTAQ